MRIPDVKSAEPGVGLADLVSGRMEGVTLRMGKGVFNGCEALE